jgi:cyclophilin family peptidyl-prolyl cis-trans isomerase
MRSVSGLWLLLWLAPALAAEQPVVELHTNHGVIVVQLNADKAPKTVENFVRYVQEGFYDGTVFHRVIPDYMIQGGGYTAKYEKKEGHEPIPSEANNHLKNQRGTLAMSRGAEADSATSQFFINLADNPKLNYSAPTNKGWGYAVFGKVIKGMEVIDKIAEVETEMDDPAKKYAPLKPVIIQKAVLKSAKPSAHQPAAAPPPPVPAEPVEETEPAEEEAVAEEEVAEEATTEETPAEEVPEETEPAEEVPPAAEPVDAGPSGRVTLDQAPELPDIPAVE